MRVYPDRVEWVQPGKVSGAKLTTAAMTAGISIAATGLRTRKGTGTNMIPMGSITSVRTHRDTVLNDVVTIIASGNTVQMRCSNREAEQLKSMILAGIAGRLEAVHEQSTAHHSGQLTNLLTAAISGRAAEPPAASPAGWYPDPLDDKVVRYWDGARWTEHLHRYA